MPCQMINIYLISVMKYSPKVFSIKSNWKFCIAAVSYTQRSCPFGVYPYRVVPRLLSSVASSRSALLLSLIHIYSHSEYFLSDTLGAQKSLLQLR